MEYEEILRFAFDERNRIDAVVEEIVRLNGQGSLFRAGEPAVIVKPVGDSFQLNNPESLFSQQEVEDRADIDMEVA